MKSNILLTSCTQVSLISIKKLSKPNIYMTDSYCEKNVITASYHKTIKFCSSNFLSAFPFLT